MERAAADTLERQAAEIERLQQRVRELEGERDDWKGVALSRLEQLDDQEGQLSKLRALVDTHSSA
jgi:hypothetical protein